MFFTRTLNTTLRGTAVRSFGPRSALRAPPSPTAGASATISQAPIADQATTKAPKSDAVQNPASTASATAAPNVPEVGDVSHAFGKARKVGDE